MSYEFNEEDEKVILNVSNLGVLLAALLIIIGVVAYFDAIIDEATGIRFALSLIQGFIFLIIGVMFITPVMAFRRVATTEGRDIEEMIGGLDVFGRYLFVTIALISLSVVLAIVEVFVE